MDAASRHSAAPPASHGQSGGARVAGGITTVSIGAGVAIGAGVGMTLGVGVGMLAGIAVGRPVGRDLRTKRARAVRATVVRRGVATGAMGGAGVGVGVGLAVGSGGGVGEGVGVGGGIGLGCAIGVAASDGGGTICADDMAEVSTSDDAARSRKRRAIC